MDKQKCKYWRGKLREFTGDEQDGIMAYADAAKDAPLPMMKKFFARAKRDEIRHYRGLHKVVKELNRHCQE